MKQQLTLEGFVEARQVTVGGNGRIHGFKKYEGRQVLVVVLEDNRRSTK